MNNKVNYKRVLLNLRAIRINQGYSQKDVAEQLGLSQNAYSKIELGYTKVTLDTLVQICNLLELEFKRFIDMLSGELIKCKGINVVTIQKGKRGPRSHK
jgi:transcriptional regulator with XRE-family HTH domain